MDYWDQIMGYRAYLPNFVNAYLNETLSKAYLNETLEDGKERLYDLYDDIREEVLEKTSEQVDALTDLMTSFVDKMLAIIEEAKEVLHQRGALSDLEIQEINVKEGLEELRNRFENMQEEVLENVEADDRLPEGVEQVLQTIITTVREMMADTSEYEGEFWSKLKQMEVKFYEVKAILADTSAELKDRISAIFKVLQEVDLENIGGEENLVIIDDEPRAS